MWVHYYDPHDPYDPPEPFKSSYPKDPYSGEIAYTDEQIGRLLDFLKEAKLQERTFVVVMGDHGEGLNDHGEKTHGIFIYDDTLHVPLLMAGPGVPPGQVVETQVRSVDLLPTVAEFLGLPPNAAAQGVIRVLTSATQAPLGGFTVSRTDQELSSWRSGSISDPILKFSIYLSRFMALETDLASRAFVVTIDLPDLTA